MAKAALKSGMRPIDGGGYDEEQDDTGEKS
jgi:hypothetical protein